MKGALLFDLDDTLVVEEPAAAGVVRGRPRKLRAPATEWMPRALASVAPCVRVSCGMRLPAHPYCMRVGISFVGGVVVPL